MRLIDADVLLRPISNYNPVKYTYEYGDVVTVQDVKSIPTVDAVPVVRCDACKNWDLDWSSSRDPDLHYCWMIDSFTDGKFYCKYGDWRKNDGK